MDVHDAILLAVNAHRGQKDKCGEDYIYHPLRVMLAMDTEDRRIVAMLHDVVEDTTITLVDLDVLGCSDAVLAGIDAVTRSPGESYADFILREKADPLGCIVKIADIRDNLGRLGYLANEKMRASLAKRYEKALSVLGEPVSVRREWAGCPW